MANQDLPNPGIPQTAGAMVGATQPHGAPGAGQIGFPQAQAAQAENGYRSPEILRKGMDQVGLWNSLRRRWALATFLGLLIAALSALALFYLVDETSKATALLQVKSQKPRILEAIQGTADDARDYELYAQTQLGVLKSDVVLRQAVDAVSDIPVIYKEIDKVAWLRNNVDAQFIRGSELLEVSLTDNLEQDELKRIVDAVVGAYMEIGVRGEIAKSRYARDELRRASNDHYETLTRKQKTYQERAKADGTAEADDTPVRAAMLMDSIRLNRKQAQELEERLAQAFLNFNLIKTQAGDPSYVDAQVQAAIAADPSIQMLNQRMMMIESQISSYKTVTKHQTPAIVQMENQKREIAAELNQKQAQLKASIAAQLESQPNNNVRQTQKMYEITRQVWGSQLQRLNEEFESLEEEATQLAESSAELAMMKAEIDQLSELQASMASRLALWGVEEQADERVSVIQPAAVSERINKFMRYFIIGSGGLFMLGLTCFGVGYMEFRNRHLDGPNQLDEGLGIRVVGTLPALSHRRMMRPGDPVALSLMESIDSVRTALMHNGSGKENRVVLVTSPSAQEGRTTVASQLAASLARAGRRTLLIDGDVRSPSIHGLFDLPLEDGLCEVLRADVDIEDAIRPTHAEGLWVLTAGYCDSDALYALANEQLQQGFDKLRDKYDFVIIDGAPVIGLSDSLILGQYCDGAILSVLRDHSQVPEVYRATETLRGVGIRMIGSVVNGVRSRSDRRITHAHLAPPKSTTKGEPVEV